MSEAKEIKEKLENMSKSVDAIRDEINKHPEKLTDLVFEDFNDICNRTFKILK